MALFVLTCADRPDSVAKRLAQRPVHLEWLNSRPDMVKLAGPFLNAAGEPVGSLVILEAETLAEVEAFAAADPYHEVDLFERVEIQPWRISVGGLG